MSVFFVFFYLLHVIFIFCFQFVEGMATLACELPLTKSLPLTLGITIVGICLYVEDNNMVLKLYTGPIISISAVHSYAKHTLIGRRLCVTQKHGLELLDPLSYRYPARYSYKWHQIT